MKNINKVSYLDIKHLLISNNINPVSDLSDSDFFTALNSLKDANESELTFFNDASQLKILEKTKAKACLISEKFVKFLPIYVLMVSDIIVSLYFLKYDVSYLGFEYFVYPHFFLHFLYIIPIIYYLSKPLSPFVLNKKNNLNTIKQGIFIFFNNWSKFYLSLILILLIIFLIMPMEF